MSLYFIHAFEECLDQLFMKNVCKKWTSFFGLFCVLWSFLFTACSSVSDSDGEFVLPPDKNHLIVHKIFPNDRAKNDSAAANLARGIMLVVHPNASYQLSFDIDPEYPAPELQLFRSFSINDNEGRVGFRKVRTLSPTVVGNRYVYSFDCVENKMSVWFTSLGVDGDYYKGKVSNISYTGVGAYNDHLSINLIVVGSMEKTLDGMDVDELSRYMLQMFREKYYGITIDTLYVRYADQHPVLGAFYPASQPWVAGLSSEDVFVSELTGWPEDNLRTALNIIFVHSINENNIMGFARLFSGVLGAGKESSVVIGEHVRKDYEIELLSSYNITMTAIHETGHFFGLRHTSVTRRDLNQYVEYEDGTKVMIGDYSNIEDGLTDTPFCENVLRNGYYKNSVDEELDGFPAGIYVKESRESLAKSNPASIEACADLDNIMFPVTVDDYENATFTEQQMEIIRSSLMIFPH